MNRFAQPADPFAYLAKEIAPGLVLHLDPDTLLEHEATVTGRPECRVQGRHSFLCVEVTGDDSQWCPLFSRPGPNRVELPRSGRRGHRAWVEGTSHLHPSQVWTVSTDAVVAAAKNGGDKSTPRQRNWLDENDLPDLAA